MNLRKMATLSLLEGKKKNRQEIEQDHNTSKLATSFWKASSPKDPKASQTIPPVGNQVSKHMGL